MAIPTSLKPKRTQTLVWVRAGQREWTTKSQPNQVIYLFPKFLVDPKIILICQQQQHIVPLQVFFESVAVGSGVFNLGAIWRH